MNTQTNQDRKNSKPSKNNKRRRRRPSKNREKPQPTASKSVEAVLDGKSQIDTALPAEIPLTPDEVTEFREHFKFLAKYRKVLRLKVNNKEDLLLTGAREPEHRGADERRAAGC